MASERQPAEATGRSSRWWSEHLHRYKEALLHIEPTDIVLDIACGSGFGTDVIAGNTRGKVIGGDIDAATIEECRQMWNRPNLEFKVLDGTKLEFSDQYFDKVVSFETIEHTAQYHEMIAEFARVLKTGGKLILSTPNRPVLSPNGVENPFHVQEFTVAELQEILKVSFSRVEMWGQRNKRYDNRSLRLTMGKLFEKLFLSIGIRKLPYEWRNGFMKLFFGYPLYPEVKDFVLEKDVSRINKECPVQFAICQKV